MNRLLLKALSVVVLCANGQLALSSASQGAAPQQASTSQQVTVTENGFQPSTLGVRANVLVRITFIRQSNNTCATEVVIPEYNIKRDLPLNKPVLVEFTPQKAGEIAFACGMNMFKGKLVVAEK